MEGEQKGAGGITFQFPPGWEQTKCQGLSLPSGKLEGCSQHGKLLTQLVKSLFSLESCLEQKPGKVSSLKSQATRLNLSRQVLSALFAGDLELDGEERASSRAAQASSSEHKLLKRNISFNNGDFSLYAYCGEKKKKN